MKFNRVHVGSIYVYKPVMLDKIDGMTTLKEGDLVQVIKSPRGTPPIGTMGHCYVGHLKSGKFIGMVCVNSLVPASNARCSCLNTRPLIPKNLLKEHRNGFTC